MSGGATVSDRPTGGVRSAPSGQGRDPGAQLHPRIDELPIVVDRLLKGGGKRAVPEGKRAAARPGPAPGG